MSDPRTSTRKPTLQEVISQALESWGYQLPKSMPARVTKYEASKQRVSCKVLVQRTYYDEEAERQTESVAVIPGVPVLFPGAGGFRVTFPISDGNLQVDGQPVPATTGLLVWCDRSLDKWLTGSGAEVDPEFDHTHGLSDAVFIPGLNPFGAALSSAPTDHATIGSDSGVQIHFHKQTIAIGDETGNDFIALAAKVKAWFDAFNAAVTGWTPVAQDGGAALKTALGTLIGGTPSTNVATTQAKAK